MSVVAATKANGGKQETLTYRAFGETRSSTGTLISRLKYTGREDDGTGLYQYRARYYDPMIGRFISEDPLGLSAGENLYAYVGNNPINANDPDGLLLNFVGGALANVVIGGAVRAATGGDVLDASAILMDLAIGAATSGAGAIAQIRHTRQILNAERDTGRVVGTAQSTGTMLHAARTEQEAVRLLDAGADVVYLNRAYSTATGVKGAGALNRPDAIGVFPGRVAAVEVASKTDDVAALAARNNTAMTNTGLTGSTSVVETQFSFRLSDDLTQLFGQRTVGAAPLDMTGVGAAYTFGGQAAYQTGQAAYQGAFSDVLGAAANGGFLLYPNKPNNNMMGTVYSK
jgi:RHS repeat-associated protein